MIKSMFIAAAVATSLFAALPANAAFSSGDCSYARAMGDNQSSGSTYHANAQVLQQCAEQGK